MYSKQMGGEKNWTWNGLGDGSERGQELVTYEYSHFKEEKKKSAHLPLMNAAWIILLPS
jgi:hypothetical protein